MNVKLTKPDMARLRQALRIAICSEDASIEAHQPYYGTDTWKANRKRSERNIAAFNVLLAKLMEQAPCK